MTALIAGTEAVFIGALLACLIRLWLGKQSERRRADGWESAAGAWSNDFYNLRDRLQRDLKTAQQERDAARRHLNDAWRRAAEQELPHRHPSDEQVIADLERQFQDGAS